MQTLNDVHQQFAEYFDVPQLKPYAYLLSRKLSEGHICLHLDKISDQPGEGPAYCANMEPGSAPLKGLPLVAEDGGDDQPFVLFDNRLYLQRYFRYETQFLQRLYRFLAMENETLAQRTALLEQQKQLVQQLFPTTPVSEPDWQLAAAVSGVRNNFTIITGGPGTGKTTTVAKILAILYTADPAIKVALAAPTGKAAARMAESLRTATLPVQPAIADRFRTLSPSTIHRLLRQQPGTPYFKHNRDNPLNYDVVIVDECSMIDVALFAKLLDAIGPATRLILLGDKDQLASVEAGSLFGDLCQAADRPPLSQHLVELRHSHRFTGDKGIGKFSKAVISNDAVVLQQFLQPGADEQVTIDTLYSEALFEQFMAGYEAFIAETDIRKALQKMNALRVLCAVREGDQGLYATNRRIEKYLHDKKWLRVNAGFYENRPVILTRNYYEHGLFNGDTGIIRPDKNGQLMAWFEDSTGELKSVLPGYLVQAETVFAMTIHKSQGSEFNEVLVLLPRQAETALLTRELLYTAVTRARKKVYVQGSAAVVLTAAQRFVERASGIAGRLAAG